MKLSAKILYAYKATVELALRSADRSPVQIQIISREQRIPQKFLVQILLRLKNEGIVESVRGVGGGYILARAPDQVTLADVVRAVDDRMIAPEIEESVVTQDAGQILRNIWSDISRSAAERLEKVTLEDVTRRLRSQELTYSI